jgi:pimeloyl-ACP methyl ester carboxylesterase
VDFNSIIIIIMKTMKHRSKLRIFLIVTGTVLSSIIGLCIAMYDSSPVGYWRSREGLITYSKTYNEALRLLPPPNQTLDIRTSFGVVRMYKWVTEQTQSATPIILIPGRSAGVPMWSSNLNAFITKHPVYAMDFLGDAGMSVQTVKIENGADQAAWLHEALSSLNVTKMHIVGHSFGGWAAANYATRYPEKVASLILLEPVFVFQGLRTEIIIKSIPAAIPFLPKSWRESMLEDIAGATEIDYADPVARMIAAGTEYYARKLPGLPEQITLEQLKTWEMPTYVAMGEKSVMHDSEKAIAVAQSNIKHIQAKNWLGGTHSLPMDFPREINAEIVKFIEVNCKPTL